MMKQLTVPIAFLMTIGSQVSAFDHADLTDANMEGVIFCNTTMPDGSVIYSGC